MIFGNPGVSKNALMTGRKGSNGKRLKMENDSIQNNFRKEVIYLANEKPKPQPQPQPNWPSKVPGAPSGPGRDVNPPKPKGK